MLLQVVCGRCSRHQVPLQYDDNKLNRVCDKCFEVLSNRVEDLSVEPNTKETTSNEKGKKTEPQRPPPPSTRNIAVNAPSVLKVCRASV